MMSTAPIKNTLETKEVDKDCDDWSTSFGSIDGINNFVVWYSKPLKQQHQPPSLALSL
jgi:hypothetical protein